MGELTSNKTDLNAYRGYIYGFQGSEKDDEVKGSGNSYTTEFRMLDPRLGRWLSIDPLAGKFPWQSPYVSMDNCPIWLNDVYGLSTGGGDEDIKGVVKGETIVEFKVSDSQAAQAARNVLSSDNASGSALTWVDNVKSGKEDYNLMSNYRKYDQSTGMHTGAVTSNGERMVNLIEHLAIIERRDPELYGTLFELLDACNTQEQYLFMHNYIENMSNHLIGQNMMVVGNGIRDVLSVLILIQSGQVGAMASNVYTVRMLYMEALRKAYVLEVEGLMTLANTMRMAGSTSQEIAIALHAQRRLIGLQYKNATPAVFRQIIYSRNLKKYGDKLGPTIDYLRKQGKTWEQIIESATRTGGKDLGL